MGNGELDKTTNGIKDFIVNTSKKLYTTSSGKIQETKEHIQETMEIKNEIEEMQKQAESRLAVSRSNFDRAVMLIDNRLTDLGEERLYLNKNLVGKFMKINNQNGSSFNHNRSEKAGYYQDVDSSDSGTYAASFALASGGGMAVAAAAYGLTAAIGTASTGTAIASLSGASAMTATLAALGGGSVAAGGAGMIGGVLTLGGLFVVPTIAIGAVLADKHIRKKYEKMKEYVDEVEESISINEDKVEYYEEVIDLLDSLIFTTRASGRFADTLLSIIEECQRRGNYDKYKAIFTAYIEKVQLLNNLSVFILPESGDEIIDPNFSASFQYVAKELKEKEIQIISQVMNDIQIREVYKEKTIIKETKITFYNRKQIQHEFRRMFDYAKNELYIASPHISKRLMNDDFLLNRIVASLKRGVKVKILYGYGNDRRMKETEERAEQIREAIYKMNDLNKTLFTMRRTDSHVKLVICDDKYILGSLNYLSNIDQKWDELANVVHSKEKCDELKRQYFDF